MSLPLRLRFLVKFYPIRNHLNIKPRVAKNILQLGFFKRRFKQKKQGKNTGGAYDFVCFGER